MFIVYKSSTIQWSEPSGPEYIIHCILPIKRKVPKCSAYSHPPHFKFQDDFPKIEIWFMLNVLALLSRPSKSYHEPIFLATFPIILHYALHANRTDFLTYIGTTYFCPADFVMMSLRLECSSSSPQIHVQIHHSFKIPFQCLILLAKVNFYF